MVSPRGLEARSWSALEVKGASGDSGAPAWSLTSSALELLPWGASQRCKSFPRGKGDHVLSHEVGRRPVSAVRAKTSLLEGAEAPPSGAIGSLTIAEVAAATGTSAHTLRYYERIGLIQPVARAQSGHRRYGPDEVRWVEFLRKLHATGMPIRRMLAYAALVRRGDSTIAERRAVLEAHRNDVAAKLAEQQVHLAIIEKKVRLYEELERQHARRRA
jgi:DNA-binding transcriptional MerR regulator